MVKKLEISTGSKIKSLFNRDKDNPLPEKVAGSLEDLIRNFDPEALYSIPQEWIDFDNLSLRTRFKYNDEAISKMADNIARQGQLQAVLLRISENGRLQIVLGWHRSYACRKINRLIKACITTATEKECRAFAVTENVVRNELSPYDTFKDVVDLREKDEYSVKEIEEIMEISDAYVYQILKIKEYPTIIEALEKEVIKSLKAARELAALFNSRGIPEDLQRKAIAALQEDQIKLENMEYFLDQEKRAAGTSPAGGKKKKEGSGPGLAATPGTKPGKDKTGEKVFFQKFLDGKIAFSAKASPEKTDKRELKKILSEGKKFMDAVTKLVNKAGK